MTTNIYKTQPRLLIVSLSFLGFLFFTIIFAFTLSGFNESVSNGFIVFSFIFLAFSLVSLYYFLNIKILKLTANSLEINYLFLPFSQQFDFSEIVSITQESKRVYLSALSSLLKESYFYTDTITSIKLCDNKTIQLNSISRMDFEVFYKTFKQLKRGEGKTKVQKRSLMVYIIDNYEAVFLIILPLFLIMGLSIAVLTK